MNFNVATKKSVFKLVRLQGNAVRPLILFRLIKINRLKLLRLIISQIQHEIFFSFVIKKL